VRLPQHEANDYRSCVRAARNLLMADIATGLPDELDAATSRSMTDRRDPAQKFAWWPTKIRSRIT
jgi:hypothetical protein